MEYDLKALYNEGFLPGPEESKIDFFKRIEATKQITNDPDAHFKGKLTKLNGSTLIDSSKKNLFFHGATTTIYQKGDSLISVIAPPSRFAKIFIPEKEIIEHEMVHARRAAFADPKYEEILAYSTSSGWRKWISPIFASTTETLIFFGTLALIPITPLPLVLYLSYLSFRLIIRWNRLKRAMLYISTLTPYSEKVIEALTDKEIKEISKGSFNNIDTSFFRWKFLTTLFDLSIV